MPRKRAQHRLSAEELDALHARACALDDQGHHRKAFRLYLRAARAGDTSSQLNVGVMYDVGKGVRRSRAQALHWYRQGARRREDAAAHNIGTLYRDESRYRLAERWFERAVSWGGCDSLLDLARLCVGPLNDLARARRLLERLKKYHRQTTEYAQEEADTLLRQLSRCSPRD